MEELQEGVYEATDQRNVVGVDLDVVVVSADVAVLPDEICLIGEPGWQ
jgi:hypothetical protein